MRHAQWITRSRLTVALLLLGTLLPLSPVSATPRLACNDNATFVADVTVPDNTPFPPGQSFVKTWRMRNTGTCDWGNNYTLNFIGGDDLGATSGYDVRARRGDQTDISIRMTAPSSMGQYQAYYQMNNDSGQSFGQQVWVTIRVVPPLPLNQPRVAGSSAQLSPQTRAQLQSFMTPQDLERFMQLLQGAMDGEACAIDAAVMYFSQGADIPPNMSQDCANVTNDVIDMINRYKNR